MASRIVTEKICPQCKTRKPAAAFHKASKRPDGLQAYCRDCCKANAHARQMSTPRSFEPNLPGEVWRPVAGFEGVYEVSGHGRVRRIGRGIGAKSGCIRKPYVNNKGYEMVDLWANGRRTAHLIHRLVAAAFLGPCPEGQLVNHIDSNTRNNRPDNLEYTNQDGNMKHASKFGRVRKGSRHQCAKLTEAEVLEIRRLHTQGGISVRELAERFGVTPGPVYHIIKRQQWKHV